MIPLGGSLILDKKIRSLGTVAITSWFVSTESLADPDRMPWLLLVYEIIPAN
jgi:hypothetical protein